MTTTDVIIVAQRHACQVEKAIADFAAAIDSGQLTEAAVCWGKVVVHADAITDLEHIMRGVLFSMSDAEESTDSAETK